MYNWNIFLDIQVFIKINFNGAQYNNKSFDIGPITDGTYKLEIQVNENYEENKYEKGQHIEIKSYVKIKGKYVI